MNTLSILDSVKKMLGIDPSYTQFDLDLIVNINSIFMVLYQMGIGPKTTPFRIEGNTAVWSDFLEDETRLDAVVSYMVIRVKNLFDPPQSSSVLNANSEILKELEWRLFAQCENDRYLASTT